jgi:colicin import membrane protein
VRDAAKPKAPDIALEKKRIEADRQKQLKALAEAEARKKTQLAEQKKRALLQQMEAEELAQRMADENAAQSARQTRQAEAQAAGKRQAELSRLVGQHRDLISAKVRGNTRLPDALKGNPEVRLLVKLLPTGEVTEVRLLKSSGNSAYDEAVERAIRKSSPLPLPAERDARAAFVPELVLVHRPRE